MRYFSDKLKPFTSYPFALLDEAKREVAGHIKVLDMGVGDPDIPTPKELQGKLVHGLAADGSQKYPSYAGTDYFKAAVRRYFLNRFRVKPKDSEILALSGSKEGLFHLSAAVLNAGDKGAYPDPGYPVYRSGIALALGEPYSLPLLPENGFLPDPADIRDGTRIVFVNYPNNPTAQVAPLSLFAELVERAHRQGFLLVNDAAYAEIYRSEKPVSILQIDGALEVALEFHSLSKSFSMCGWRVGFVVGNAEAVAALAALKRQLDSGVWTPIQAAASEALNHPEIAEPIRAVYNRRINAFSVVLRNTGLFAEVYDSPATFYIWVRLADGVKSEQFCADLLRKTGILALPGVFLGERGEGFVRFSLTLPDSALDEALQRLDEFAETSSSLG